MEDYLKSGKIASQARSYGFSLLKENALLLDVIEKVENKIRELGGKPAFPADLSINYIAAHDSPKYNDDRRLKKGDIVKLDLGVHVNGKITDTAITTEIGTNNHKKLIEASKNALMEVEKNLNPKIKVNEIGKIIESTIKKHGFVSIKNLSGHEIDDYVVHAGLLIPNYDNHNEDEIGKKKIIAIEPFATEGDGMVIEGKPSEVYSVVNDIKTVRDSSTRDILKFIKEEYRTLPFCKRWIANKFNILKANIALNALEKEGIIKQYPQLVERARGLVSQTEHTFLIDDEVICLTK